VKNILTREVVVVRRDLAAVVLMMSIVVPMTTLHAQHFGTANPAVTHTTIDASALRSGGQGFVQYSAGSQIDWMFAGGVSVAGGSLWTGYGEGNFRRYYSAGYARPIVRKSLGSVGTSTVGVDLSVGVATRQVDQLCFVVIAAYQAMCSTVPAYPSRGARVAIPFALRWGHPSRASIASFIAPYAEAGRAYVYHMHCVQPAWSCSGPRWEGVEPTRAAGVGAGFELSLWRLGLTVAMRDVLRQPDVLNALPLVPDRQLRTDIRVRF
jgi:hypothetical protein